MLVLIAKHIGAPTGATATTIQGTSGSATKDSGGITDTLTSLGGHAEAEAHNGSGVARITKPRAF